MLKNLCLVASASVLMQLAAWADTQTINYPDFSDVSGLQINGNASQQGAKLRLTPADFNQSGSAFATNSISLTTDASFSSFFSFEILNRGGLGDGADGLVFAVQTSANNVGGSGGGLGYAGIPNSLGIEFDTFDNGEIGGSNHVGIDLNGSVSSVASTGTLSPDFDNGAIWYAWVDYNGGTQGLEVRWSETSSRPTSAGLQLTVNLPSVLNNPDVFVGFTSGTGSGYGEHNILSWAFVNEYVPGGVTPTIPEPNHAALLLVGLAGMSRLVRRHRRH